MLPQLLLSVVIVVFLLLAWGTWLSRPYAGLKWVLLPRPAGLAERTRALARKGSPLADIEAFPIDDYPRLGSFCEALRALSDHERFELTWFAERQYERKPATDRWVWDWRDPESIEFAEFGRRSPGAMGACLAVRTLKSFHDDDTRTGIDQFGYIWSDEDSSRPRGCWIVAMETVATIGCALVEGDAKTLDAYRLFTERLGV